MDQVTFFLTLDRILDCRFYVSVLRINMSNIYMQCVPKLRFVDRLLKFSKLIFLTHTIRSGSALSRTAKKFDIVYSGYLIVRENSKNIQRLLKNQVGKHYSHYLLHIDPILICVRNYFEGFMLL